MYLCAEVGGRIPTFDFSYKKLKILPFMVTDVDSFRFEEIVSGNSAFQET